MINPISFLCSAGLSKPLKEKKTDKLYLFLAFLLPFLAIGIGFALDGVHPFGDKQMLYSDLRQQYYPFLVEFQRKLQNGSNLFYSWNGGFGTDFWGMIAYYIASPLNLLTVFLPAAVLREAMTVFLMIKLGCAGWFFALLLHKIYHRCDISTVFFGWMYAFCSYAMGYYWNVIWMDTFALLPLVVLGLYSLITEGKFRLYVLSLAAAILANYYIGFFVCFFAVVFFFSVCAIRGIFGKNFLKTLGRFAGYSILAGALTAVLILHVVLSLGSTDSGQNNGFGDSLEFYDSFLEVISNLWAFQKPTVMSGLPNLYCGIPSLLLMVVFLRSPKVRLAEKVSSILFLAFIMFSANFNLLDYILHGFHFPNMLPARYSFLFCFVLLLIGYRGFTLLRDLKIYDFVGMAILTLIMIGLSFTVTDKIKLLGNSVLTVCYIVILLLYEQKLLKETFFHFFFFFLAGAELSASLIYSMDSVGKTDYNTYPYAQETISGIADRLREEDPSFYRMEMTGRYYLNDGFLYNYPGIGQFSSTANRTVTSMMSGFGFTTGANSYYYNYSSPLTNSLFGLKYFISRDNYMADITNTEFMFKENGMAVYRNTKYLSTGFMTRVEAAEFEFTNSPFSVQNNLFQALTGLNSNLFLRGGPEHLPQYESFESFNKTGQGTYKYETGQTSGVLTLTYTANRSGPVYAYMRISGGGDIRVQIGEQQPYTFAMSTLRYIAPVGNCEAGDKITFRIMPDKEKTGTISLYFYYLNTDAWQEGYDLLADEQWNVTEYTDTILKGTVSVKEDGLLYTSVPYSKDWTLYVDGQKAEITPVLGNAFIGTVLTAGEHTVELRFIPRGFCLGLIVSLCGVVIFLLLCIRARKHAPTPFLSEKPLQKTLPPEFPDSSADSEHPV